MMRPHSGFSLIELMLSLGLGALVVIAIVQLFVTNSAGNALLGGQARLQENARTALELIGRSVRNAGYYGCGPSPDNVVMALQGRGDEIFEFDALRPLQSISGGDGIDWYTDLSGNGGIPAASRIAGDVLVARSVGVPQLRLAVPLAPHADPIVAHAGGQPPFRTDEVLMVADCDQGAVFRVTGLTETAEGWALHRTAGPAGTPFANAAPAVALSRTAQRFGRDTVVAPLWTTAFYVAPSTTDVNNRGQAVAALWMKEGPRAPVELVAGIEHLAVRFGIDEAGSDPPRVHRWVPFVDVPSQTQLVAIRVDLTVNSIDAVSRDGELVQRAFSETIMLRNGRQQ